MICSRKPARWPPCRHARSASIPQWTGCYYHPAVWHGRLPPTLDAPLPPLRTNCTRPSRGYVARPADKPFEGGASNQGLQKCSPLSQNCSRSWLGQHMRTYLATDTQRARCLAAASSCLAVARWLGGFIVGAWSHQQEHSAALAPVLAAIPHAVDRAANRRAQRQRAHSHLQRMAWALAASCHSSLQSFRRLCCCRSRREHGPAHVGRTASASALQPPGGGGACVPAAQARRTSASGWKQPSAV